MDFAWSEAKRIAVLEARGLDFIDAEILLDGRPLYTVPSPRRRVDPAKQNHSHHHDEEGPQ